MKILHYSLGFPPYRTGGMTKFCIDLMEQQSIDAHQAALMWPGRIRCFGKKVSVKDRGMVSSAPGLPALQSFEVINPLPVSYDEGISEFAEFTREAGEDAYSRLLDCYQPDAIHVHTLMGLHKSFLMAAKAKGVKMVFTAHDFFPICPKVTMFQNGAVCSCVKSCEGCGVCNTTALGMHKLILLQSPLYRRMKDSPVTRKLRKQHRDNYLSKNTLNHETAPVGTAEDFLKLRSYYGAMLSLMDVIHFNSTVTQKVYESVFDLPENCVIGITHGDVADHRKVKEFSGERLRLRYLGPYGGAKGFFYLRRRLINYGGKDRIFAWMSILRHQRCRRI